MNEKEKHAHEWVVFSTALQEGCLMLQCVECGAMATVDAPTKAEWADAYYAPSAPYRWEDESRVHLRHEPPCPFHVVRADKAASTCTCAARHGRSAPGEYERFPAEIMQPDAALSQEEKTELEGLAELVSNTDLCSNLFPFFIQSTGNEPTGVVKRIASRIEQIDGMGMHLSPSVVAKVLRQHAQGGIGNG